MTKIFPRKIINHCFFFSRYKFKNVYNPQTKNENVTKAFKTASASLDWTTDPIRGLCMIVICLYSDDDGPVGDLYRFRILLSVLSREYKKNSPIFCPPPFP